jgi:hypothetical protein
VNSSPDPSQELLNLIEALCLDELTPEQAARLEELVTTDPAARRHYVRFLHMHALAERFERPDLTADAQGLTSLFGEAASRSRPDDQAANGSRVSRLTGRLSRVLPRAIDPVLHPFRFGMAASLLTIVFCGAFYAILWASRQPDGGARKILADSNRRPVVARVTGASEPVWGQASDIREQNASLVVGHRLELASGLVEVTFGSGAVVVLEGPARFVAVSRGSGRLERGTLCGQVPTRAKGFRIDTPLVEVIDLGTEFAIEVGNRGATGVHVFLGVVETLWNDRNDQPQSLRLAAGQAAQFSARTGAVVRSASEPRRFRRELAPAPAGHELNLDLADIVGHGDGTGTGRRDVGINPRNGESATPQAGHIAGPNAFHRVAAEANPHGYIDGVFVPYGDGAQVVLDSAGHRHDRFTNAEHGTWCNLINGPNCGETGLLDGVDYAAGLNSVLGMHASMGITFDLNPIRARYPERAITQFTAMAGIAERAGSENADVVFHVFIDGQLIAESPVLSRNQRHEFKVELGETNRFLALVTTNGGDDCQFDRAILGNPRLTLVQREGVEADIEATPRTDGEEETE